MQSRLTRRKVLAGLASSVGAGPALANAPVTSIFPVPRPTGLGQRRSFDGLLANAGLSGVSAFAVASVDTGDMLETHQADLGQPPASVAKALTALYALDVLGPAHRFQTRLLATKPIVDGVLDGDLILAGGGDPTLDTDDLATMALALKETGLRELRGQFMVYDGALPFTPTIDPLQPDQVGYSPGVSGIALNFNRVHFEWKRTGAAYGVTMDARTAKYRPEVAMAKMRVADRSTPIYTYADKGRIDDWSVARGALGSGGARWLPIRKPAMYAGDVFQTLARSNGIVLGRIEVVKRLSAETQTLVVHNSEPLTVILKGMLKYSTNLTAEMVGLSATRAQGIPMQSLSDSALAMSVWAAGRYGMDNTLLVDHSGLGDASRMTAQDLARALVQVRQRGILRPLLKPFTLVDQQGRPIRDHPVKVDAKTGTLNFVSGLGGFVTTASGTELAFAIFSADLPRRAALSKAERERPPGGKTWAGRARKLQRALLERWGRFEVG